MHSMVMISVGQGVAILCVIATIWVTWKVAMSAHDKIDWVMEDVDGQILAISMMNSELERRVDALHERVERMEKSGRDAQLDATRVRVKKIAKIGGAK